MDKLRHRARDLRNNAIDAECALWQALRERQLQGFRFRRQVPIGGFIADFVCPQVRLIIELDGGQHAERSEYDAARTSTLEAMGCSVLRYWNDDVLLRLELVVDDILSSVDSLSRQKQQKHPSQPSPPLRERERARSNGKGDDE